MKYSPEMPINTIHLFPKLDNLLIDLLKSLTPDEWNKPTVAKLWTVKDIASHLLDGTLRTLSFSRDNYFGETPENINSYQDLVNYLNKLNMDWTSATKRLSPHVLINLLETSGKEYNEHIASLDPFGKAIFSVDWAGEKESKNWFHIAREYTEKWHHQQQIRDAVGKAGIMTKELYYPLISTFMHALPHVYRNIYADKNTVIKITITSEIGGDWFLKRTENDWELSKDETMKVEAHIQIPPETAWKLFTKAISLEAAESVVSITGNSNLAKTALTMVAVMALREN
jgi:hypothetical protein